MQTASQIQSPNITTWPHWCSRVCKGANRAALIQHLVGSPSEEWNLSESINSLLRPKGLKWNAQLAHLGLVPTYFWPLHKIQTTISKPPHAMARFHYWLHPGNIKNQTLSVNNANALRNPQIMLMISSLRLCLDQCPLGRWFQKGVDPPKQMASSLSHRLTPGSLALR